MFDKIDFNKEKKVCFVILVYSWMMVEKIQKNNFII